MGKPRSGPAAAICLLFPSAVMAYGITGFNSGVGYHPWLIPGVLTILLFAALARCTPLRLRPVPEIGGLERAVSPVPPVFAHYWLVTVILG